MEPAFVHLHVHTEYSLVNGTVRIKPLVSSVAAAGMPAVAVTEQCNMFSMVKFYRAAMAAGVKPLVGVDVWIADREDGNPPARLVLLCRDRGGYLNLTRLVSRAYIEGQRQGVPVLARDWLDGATDGLIALSGGRAGDVGQALLANKPELAASLLDEWRQRFPDAWYLELQRTGRPGEEDYIHLAVELAAARDVPVVATNDVHFIEARDFEAHEARVCINEGRTLDDPRRSREFTDQQYLRTPEEMQALFSDIPEALENTVEIARRCNLELELGKNYLPDFPVPDGSSIDGYFIAQAEAGLDQRLQTTFDPDADVYARQCERYRDRLQLEIDVILQMGFPGYFLIVADFIKWSKANGIPVGPGRGSGAGSLVAYALTITDLDPIRYDLLFERFLNPERVSMPDFDVDFCMEGRDRVIDYVAERYGREKVSQIITYGSMAAKAVVRDVGRVLGHPYGFVDRIAKLIPFEIGMTLDKALEQEPLLAELHDTDEEVQAVIDLARSLEGLARNAGKHAGGVVIAPSRLTDFTPLYCEQGSDAVVSQFDKDDVEAVGLVKFDFLGLRTLTIIDWALKTINRRRAANNEPPVDISALPLDDKPAFALLKASSTTAVFQLESTGMKDLIRRLQPDTFEDIVALVALFRPGPLQSGMVDDFIARKHGARIEYPHPELEPILQPTYGIILYQEQVMQIAQVLAGYTLGGADLLRRAMGKKKPEEMAKQRTVFLAGAEARGVDDKVASYIFDLMEKFAGYGFNKSHSAAYALISYQTAWLKAHYPAAFMAAVLSADMDNTDKIVHLIAECRDMKLSVVPPDINQSDYMFTVENDSTILYGLGAIKGVGQSAIEAIMEAREQGGAFADLYELCQRVDLRKVNRRVFEALIRAGALDTLGETRATQQANLAQAFKLAEQRSRDEDTGQNDLFGAPEVATSLPTSRHILPEWEEEQRLQGEMDALGLYLTGHPIERYTGELANIITGRLAGLADLGTTLPAPAGKPGRPNSNEKPVTIAGLVMSMRIRKTQRGGKIAFLTLDDRTARLDVRVFPEVYDKYQALLGKNKVLVVQGGLGLDDFTGGYQVTAQCIYDINQARELYARQLVVGVGSGLAGNGFVGTLAEILEPFREGHTRVCIDYRGSGAQARVALGDEWTVHPTDELLHRLRDLAGKDSVQVEYP
ncbi:MAG: DNA polymerase III subunit alpha [Thiohalobacterales bacterium]|nr:DNA polymerase III subunit alpha [Thiohalobacterales bacterium]